MVPAHPVLAGVSGKDSGKGRGKGQHWQLPSSGYPGWSVAPDPSKGGQVGPLQGHLGPQLPHGRGGPENGQQVPLL